MNEYNNRTGDFGPQPATYRTGRPAEPLPQPECASCHGIHAPTVQEASERVRAALIELAAGRPTTLIPNDVRVLLTALERHHSSVVEP